MFVLHASNGKITEEAKNQEYKYPIRINENIALGLFKEKFVEILIEPNDNAREKQLIELQESIEK